MDSKILYVVTGYLFSTLMPVRSRRPPASVLHFGCKAVPSLAALLKNVHAQLGLSIIIYSGYYLNELKHMAAHRPAIANLHIINVMINNTLHIEHTTLNEICHRYHISRLALFGSVLRGEQQPDSDIDLLVEFAEGKTPGLAFFTLQDELSALFRRKVDLNTQNFLSRYFRQQVIAEAEELYVS